MAKALGGKKRESMIDKTCQWGGRERTTKQKLLRMFIRIREGLLNCSHQDKGTKEKLTKSKGPQLQICTIMAEKAKLGYLN